MSEAVSTEDPWEIIGELEDWLERRKELIKRMRRELSCRGVEVEGKSFEELKSDIVALHSEVFGRPHLRLVT